MIVSGRVVQRSTLLLGLTVPVLGVILVALIGRAHRTKGVEPDAPPAPSRGEVRRLAGHEARINCLFLSADGRRLFTGGGDGTMRLWDVESGAELRRFAAAKQPFGEVTSLGASADGRHALTNGSDDTVRLWDAGSGAELRLPDPRVGAGIACVTLSADARRALLSDAAAFGNGVNLLRLWDVETWTELGRYAMESPVLCIAMTADGRRALLGDEKGIVRLWDIGGGRELRRFEGHVSAVRTVALSADGRRALSGGDDRTVRLWDTETGREIRRLEHDAIPGRRVLSVAMTPDARLALSGGDDSTLRLWDLDAGRELHRLTITTDWVRCVALTADGRRAVSGIGRLAYVWDISTWASRSERTARP